MGSNASAKRADERGEAPWDLEAVQASRVRRLGGAVAALTQELVATRGELQQLRSENTQLRLRLGESSAKEPGEKRPARRVSPEKRRTQRRP
jgi:regulator of replication initiation timing